MTAKNLQNIEPSLEDSGFVETDAETFTWKAGSQTLPLREALPWTLAQWTVEALEGFRYKQRYLGARLLREDLLANIEAAMQADFPSFRAVAALDDRQKGFWLLFEFCDRELDSDQSRIIEEDQLHATQLPHGLAGLHVELVQSQGLISLFMTRHFFLGNVPGSLFLELPRIVALGAFGGKVRDEIQYNLYSASLKSQDLRRELIAACELPKTLEHKLLATELDSEQIHLDEHGSSWTLAWEESGELPPLVIPPIEVLELKEVARRFQRLDDLIVQRDYEQALKQCYEYLAKSPQSLYLIRRLAFLTLWAGRPLERHYLDLMARLDGQNLMSISMAVHSCVGDQQRHQVLEHLSRLGNSLGQSMIDFEVADITSLTLPEMLGDAWNIKDDKRAVACYERVLQARGEVPRILVKLIRLMRDLHDPVAEEAYMDRLLACEVPVRTRAAIYFRLAEIKEGLDLKEAVQWALKSWQTNRSHVRYAMLAARLLLSLSRPQDAIHVLVETSEQFDAKESMATRLELELQIATIWLEHMNRHDLAAERLSRARELAGDDPLAFGRMAHIAEHLGDQSQHVDLLLMAFDTAIKAADQTRADFAVASLIDLARDISDLQKQKDIYTIVLSHHLLDAPRLGEVFANRALDLPFASLLPATEAMLSQRAPEAQGHYFELLGKLSAERLAQPEAAARYFEAALSAAHFSQAAFDFLDQHYAAAGQAVERHRLLKLRYNFAPVSEKSSILRDLFYFDEGVDDASRDTYAVELFALDADDRGPLEERIAVYQQQGQAAALTQLLEAVIAAVPRSEGLKALLEDGVRALSTCADKERFAGLARLMSTLSSLQNDPLATARMALPYFWPDPEKAYVRPYLEVLIRHGELGELDPDEVLTLLRDEELKVDLLMELAAQVSENRAIGYLRRALRLGRQLKLPLARQQVIIQKLSPLTLLQEDELEQLAQAARASGAIAGALSTISQQLSLVQDDSRRAKLCVMAGEFLVAGPADDGELDLICKSLSLLPDAQQNVIRVRWLELRGVDARLHDRNFMFAYLAELKNWLEGGPIIELLKNVANEDKPAVQRLVNQALQSFIDAANYEELEHYLSKLETQHIFEEAVHYQLFESFVKKPDLKRAQQHLTRAIIPSKKAIEAEKWLKSAQELLLSLELPQLFLDVLHELLDPSRHPPIQADVLREINICYARWQVMQGRDLRKVLSILEQLYALDQMDQRLWGPLIVIYREFNADTDLYELLYRVMPMLRSHPEILRPFRINLKQIEEDMITMSQRLGLMPELTEITMVGVQFPQDVGSSEAELLGPYGTAVNSPNDQRDISTVIQETEPKDDISQATLTARTPTLTRTRVSEGTPQLPELNQADSAFTFPSGEAPALPPPPPEPLAFGPLVDLDSDEPDQLTQKLDLSFSGMQVPTAIMSPLEKEEPLPPRSQLTELAAPWDPQSSLPPLPGQETREEPRRAPPEFKAEDWRKLAQQTKAEEGYAAWLQEQALGDALEQHVAVQAAALAENQLASLETWSHRVWRQPDDVFYELRWNERMGREMFHPGLKSPLLKLIKTMQPLIKQQFAAQLSSKTELERLKLRFEDVQRMRRKIDWNEDLIQRSILRFYGKFFAEAGFTLFHLPKLEERIQYLVDEREIYIDREHYLAAPPTHLAHRLLFLYRSLQIESYELLHLSPHNDIYPFLLKCRRSLELNRMDNVRRMLGMEKDSLKLIFSQVDREHLDTLFAEVGTLTPDKIAKACSVFVEQIYRINLAETLDLVGIAEAISGQDLLSAGSGNPPLQNPLIRHLLGFAAELKLTGQF